MTGYQEIVTDPSYAEQLVCFTAPMVGNYGVATARSESQRPHARAGADARGARPRLDGLAARARHRRAHRASTRARLVLKLRDARRDARRRRRRRRRRSTRRCAACASSRRWRAARSSPTSRPTEPYVYTDGRARPRRGRRLRRASARSCGRLAAAGAAVTVYPHDVDAGRARALRRRAALERARRSRSRSATRSRRCASCSAACRCSASASATSCSRSRPGMKTFKLPFGHRGANHPVLERATGRVLVTTQNHGFAVAPSEEREATHVSLYDGTVEGLDFPRAARALGAVPSRGRPGPARRVADHRASSSRSCGAYAAGAPTSARSA